MTFAFALQCAASVTTILSMWLMGNRSLAGPAVGLVSQVVWCGVIGTGNLWGLSPITACLCVVHTRNLVKWYRERGPQGRPPADEREQRSCDPPKDATSTALMRRASSLAAIEARDRNAREK
jgi:hypothetical protein